MNKRSAFTLVELIIVITILAILSVSAFLVVSQWIGKSRDSRRLSDLSTIQKSLEVSSTQNSQFPLPDSYSIIQLNLTEVVSYQGTFGDSARSNTDIKSTPKDPLDNEQYIYVVSANRKNIQVAGFLENNVADVRGIYSLNKKIAPLADGNLSNDLFALVSIPGGKVSSADYTNRIFTTKGSDVGVVLSASTDQPVNQTTSSVIMNTVTAPLNIRFNNNKIVSGTGLDLYGILQTLKAGGFNYSAPSSCPSGFIPVPGNPNFQQPGFCVAKYEMKYTDAAGKLNCIDVSSNCGAVDVLSMKYQTGATIVSKPETLPIGYISAQQAVTACKSLGNDYHLITNNERMTVSKNIESVGENWSSGVVGGGGLYRGPVESSVGQLLGCMYSEFGAATGLLLPAYQDDYNLSSNRTTCAAKRQLKLSNGQIIRDLSGNAREHVNKSNSLDGQFYTGQGRLGLSSINNAWAEWTSISEVDRKKYGPEGAYDASKGVGRFYQGDGNIMIRGRTGSTGIVGGLYSLTLNYNFDSLDRQTGFRCVYMGT